LQATKNLTAQVQVLDKMVKEHLETISLKNNTIQELQEKIQEQEEYEEMLAKLASRVHIRKQASVSSATPKEELNRQAHHVKSPISLHKSSDSEQPTRVSGMHTDFLNPLEDIVQSEAYSISKSVDAMESAWSQLLE
jgi:hypothetical protein